MGLWLRVGGTRFTGDIPAKRLCPGRNARSIVEDLSYSGILATTATTNAFRDCSSSHRLVSTGSMARWLALPLAVLNRLFLDADAEGLHLAIQVAALKAKTFGGPADIAMKLI